ncbi:hypothetical protein KI387_037395, partial [Taxus chinensis]
FKGGLHDPFGRLGTWNNSTDCCTWKGIKCDNGTHRVIRLDLRNPRGYNPASALRNLADEDFSLFYATGVLPSEINDGVLSPLFELQMLKYLDLSYNALIGVGVPRELHSLKNLQYLNLSNAGFVGEIPRELGNMSRLQQLDLSTDYYFSSSSISLRIEDIRMWNLRDLEELLLDG